MTSPREGGLWMPTWTLWRREMVRFLRQRSRIIGAFGTPVVFWLIAGLGIGKSLRLPGGDDCVNYLQYSFPGAIASILMFTAIFSTISIIDDRKEGFMQGVLAAPVPRSAIALGKVLGATTLAVFQALIFLFFGRFAGIAFSPASVILSFLAMVLLAFSVTSLGFFMAWRMDSTQSFHAVMNIFLMPMLILSGAFFPPQGSWWLMSWIVKLNPMTYGVTMLRAAIHLPVAVEDDWWLGVLISILFAAIMFFVLIRTVTRETAQAIH
jgi:ABC-2 type transport system permease protein